MDLEENGYVQKRIRFFMGLNFITLSSVSYTHLTLPTIA